MITQYIRYNNKLIGVMVALDADKIGWSVCRPDTKSRKGDKFNKDVGLRIALQRAKADDDATKEFLREKIPYRKLQVVHPLPVKMDDGSLRLVTIRSNVVEDAIKTFAERANRYFKETDVVGI